MKQFKISVKIAAALLNSLVVGLLALSSTAWSDCQIIDNGQKAPFDGSSLKGLAVEKSSLVILNNTFPNLNVIEGMFKGEVLTCTSCTEKYVTCKN